MPETIATKSIYKGRIFDVSVDTIREGEVEYEREIVVHKGSAVIVPVFEDTTVALVRQYRHAAGKYLLEIPAGSHIVRLVYEDRQFYLGAAISMLTMLCCGAFALVRQTRNAADAKREPR